jgi:hypothetical protein
MSIVQTISPFEYIGNSLQKINNNFNNFDSYFTKLSADAIVALRDFRTAITNQQSYILTTNLTATDVVRLDRAVTINSGNVVGTTLIGSNLAPTTIGGDLTVTGALTLNGTASVGSATATTAATNDNSTKVATTAFVKNQNYITTAAGQFSLGTDGGTISINKSNNTSTTTIYGSTVSLAGASNTTTTQANNDNSTKIATTAFVNSYVGAQSFLTSTDAQTNFGTTAGGQVTIGNTNNNLKINSGSTTLTQSVVPAAGTSGIRKLPIVVGSTTYYILLSTG